jgi:hypothetical protein
METAKLKKFAQFARRSLIEQVSAKLNLVLAEGSAARREQPKAITELEKQLYEHDREQVFERIAYTWFNRFCALRFMDVNRYTRIGVVSPAEGQSQPEILAEAKMGHIDEEMVPEKIRQQIFALLNGTAPSRDPQAEAYRLLVVAACNDYHRVMPYLFERIAHFTELLMPDDLLSGNSILAYTRETMTPDVCGDVEVIGWLYQFYISEKKDKVFDDLKKNKKITPENIPAATQLFTPHWIVRYLVENSLGRLWMLNRPNSKLIDQMDYYIKPEQPESDFLRINKPEEIKICDPACGSGHILTYAFDILYAIYEEEGYEPSEIPEKILTHNLYGIEIDERAGELAAFALTMKARARQRRFFRKPVQPKICVLQNIWFDDVELKNYMDFIRRDLFTAPLQTTLQQFEEADNFGSLIRPAVTDVVAMLNILEAKNISGQLFLGPTHQKVLQALQQADYLNPRYHVVIANPPYMGSGGFNQRLKKWCGENGYRSSRSDLYAAFIQRSTVLGLKKSFVAMVTRHDWAFTKSYEYLREEILLTSDIEVFSVLGKGIFETLTGEVVQPAVFCFRLGRTYGHSGLFCNASDTVGKQKEIVLSDRKNYHGISEDVFENIPLKALIFWKSQKFLKIFLGRSKIADRAICREGIHTGNNERFLKLWWEVEDRNLVLNASSYEDLDKKGHYVPYNKGGTTCKWFGGNDVCIAFSNKYREEMKKLSGHVRPSESLYFLEGGTWADVSTKGLGIRYYPQGFLFADAGPVICGDNIKQLISNMNSKPFYEACRAVMPNLHFKSGTIQLMPVVELNDSRKLVDVIATTCVERTQEDYNSFETSWGFTNQPLLNHGNRHRTLRITYLKLRTCWQEMTLEMQRLEEENNRIFIDAYGLLDELTPEVPLNEITLTCNPHYRYSNSKNAEELEALLLADTMKEFISYAVGCMFGRYALDKPGLILANQGDTIEEYLCQIPDPTFPPDEDNVIPILDGDWFPDDISERFRKFLRITFGEENYEENLKFIEVALGKEIRKYFLKDFYNDHLRRYKKRPIYWLFSSSKGSFNALIYMHRYRPDTVSVVLNGYLREFRTKLLSDKTCSEAESISVNATSGQKSEALRKIDRFKKMIAELESYEREILYPLATQQLEIDLDDGVKVNYQKFGSALKKIPGLDAKEE